MKYGVYYNEGDHSKWLVNSAFKPGADNNVWATENKKEAEDHVERLEKELADRVKKGFSSIRAKGISYEVREVPEKGMNNSLAKRFLDKMNG